MSFFHTIFPELSWDTVYFGNSFATYAGALFLFCAWLFGLYVLQKVVLFRLEKWAKKTANDFDDALIRIFKTLKPPFYIFIAFYVAIRSLSFEGLVKTVVDSILIIWLTFQIIAALQILLEFVLEKRILVGDDSNKRSALKVIGNIFKGILWGMGMLIILSNLGVNITSLIAGLGVGGIAVAFALQNILEDLFSSFTIYFDKPFEVGDFIVVGSVAGSVQHIGMKSTRIKSLQGEEVVVSNKELTTATIQNFKKMERRRVVFTFGITYETSTDTMKTIPNTIATIFDSIEKAELDRAHFKSFDDSALSFEVVYFVLSSDYALYMDIQQELNYRVKDAFDEKGISMAYPTQTLYIENTTKARA
jgi:small-conductance mechanosensitive channel